MPQDNIKELIQEAEHLKTKRVNWENLWQDVSDLVNPTTNNITRKTTEGEDKTWYRYDSTAVVANKERASHLIGILANPEMKWLEVSIKGFDSEDNLELKEWLEEVAKRYMNVLRDPACRFYEELDRLLIDDGAFGVGALLVQKGRNSALNFRAYNVKDFVHSRNDEGAVDRFFLFFKLTLNQAISKFGLHKLSDNLKKEYRENSSKNKEYEFIHIVIPRKNRDRTRENLIQNKRFVGYFVEKNECHIIDEQGYDKMPYEVFMGRQRTDESYPDSPAIDTIDTIRQLNHEAWLEDYITELGAMPPVEVASDGMEGGEVIDLSPGGSVVVNSRARAGGNAIRPIFPVADLRPLQESMFKKQSIIQSAFMVLELEAMRKANMSATEAIINNERQLRKASPVILRLFASLGRLLERGLEIIFEQDIITEKAKGTENLQEGDLIFPLLPEDLDTDKIKFKFKSPLAKSLRQEEFESLQLQFQFLSLIAQVNPDIIDYYDSVATFKIFSSTLGVPTETMRSDDEAAEIQEAKAQQQAQAQQLAILEQGANVAKTAGEASQLFQE